jgi:hypothetical protein
MAKKHRRGISVAENENIGVKMAKKASMAAENGESNGINGGSKIENGENNRRK